MEFEEYSSEQYRALDDEQLEERRSLLLSLADGGETPDSVMKKLPDESVRCSEEFERRNKLAHLRAAEIAAVERSIDEGKAIVVERWDNGKGVTERGGIPVRSAESVSFRDDTDPHDTAEYRSAFQKLVCKGIETRSDAFTMTTDAPVAIPTTLSNMVIEKLDTYGEIYPLVSKSQFQGGYEIPIDNFDFTAKWVGEDEVTDVQKAERKNKLSFSYHEFEARVGISWLAGIVTFDAFQAKFSEKMSKAIVKLLEDGIVNGTGTGQMLGITNDSRITNVIEMDTAMFDAWQTWHNTVDAAIDPAYEDGRFLMPKTTWCKHIDTLADSNKAPIAQYHYDPVSGKRVNTLVGKGAMLLGSTMLKDFDKAEVGDVVAIYGDLSNYNINWQPGAGISIMRYADNDKRKNTMLGYGVCDGKVVDPYGFILIKKKDDTKSTSTTGGK